MELNHCDLHATAQSELSAIASRMPELNTGEVGDIAEKGYLLGKQEVWKRILKIRLANQATAGSRG